MKQMTLRKAQIVDEVHRYMFWGSRKKIFDVVETILESTKSILASGGEILISGFGKFCVKDKRELRGRNSATGEDMILAPRRVVTFKCSRQLRDRVNGIID